MNNWITIATYEYSQQAHMVKNYLESEGIVVFMKDDMTAQVASYYAHAIGGIKLQVREDDFDRAIEVLEKGGYIKDKSDFKNVEVEIVKRDQSIAFDTCPFCKSKNIEKLKQSDAITTAIYSILGAIFPLLRLPYKCNDCKKVWKYKR